MRNPTPEELAPLVEAHRELETARRKQARELRPLIDAAEDLGAALAEKCGVPPGAQVDAGRGLWVDPKGNALLPPG